MSNLPKTWLLWIGLALAWSLAASVGAEDETLWVIVHPSVPAAELTPDQLTAIFTLSQRVWPGGQSVIPYNYDPANSLRQRFDRLVLGMDSDEVARFWIDRKIRGQGDSPRKVPSVALMVRIVANLPGAIGYVPAGTPATGTKVVAQVPRRAGAK